MQFIVVWFETLLNFTVKLSYAYGFTAIAFAKEATETFIPLAHLCG